MRRKREWFENERFWRELFPYMFQPARFEQTAAEVRHLLRLVKLAACVLGMVERNPQKWRGYGLCPLKVVKSPASPYYAPLREAVEANLDFLIAEQNTDGSWHPTWTWGNAFPETWPVAKREWQGILTLDALKVLRAFGRV